MPLPTRSSIAASIRASIKAYNWLPWLVLALAVGMTCLLWWSSRHHEKATLSANFDLRVELAARRAEQAAALDERLLKSVQSLFLASDNVTKTEFLTFTDELLDPDEHRALLSIEYVKPAATKIGGSEQKFAVPAYHQSFGRIPSDFVTDLAENYRRDAKNVLSALERSAESGEATLSSPFLLRGQRLMQMSIPLYDQYRDTAHRKEGLLGWIVITLDGDNWMEELFRQEAQDIALRIYQGPSQLFYENFARLRLGDFQPNFHASQPFRMLDRLWNVSADSTPRFEEMQNHTASNLIAICGSVISLCLFFLSLQFLHRIHVVDEVEAMNARLIKSEERWKFALEGAGDGIWDWDVEQDEVMRSPQWKHMLGIDEETDIPVSIEECKKRIHPEDLPHAVHMLERCLRGDTRQFISEHRMLCNDGSWKWVLARAIVVARSISGRPLRMVGTHTDISKLKESEHLVWRQANFDQLTNLPNRRMFYNRLEQEIRKCHRAGAQLALLFLDLDHFKEINDTLGHDRGDLLLQHAAMRISEGVRETDTVARLGGDEFIVIISELDSSSNVDRVAQDILNRLSQPFNLGTDQAFISASIGITLYPDDGTSIDNLLKNVDQAMYAAKAGGRGRFSYYTPAMQAAASHKMQIGNDLRAAMNGSQFQVFFQPIIALASGKIHKAEALLRWDHPLRGMISPAEFIPIAEETGLISPIGDWVFHQVVDHLRIWRRRYNADLEISINKSPVQFRTETTAHGDWFAYLDQAGIPGSSIIVEITEGLLLDASPNTSKKLAAFQEAGIRLALDDFGTGYSSLAYLRRFDIDFIKIDQSFVRNIAPGSEDMALCESIIAMAHKLGLMVVAEGVETEIQLALLREAGCDFGQGYLFSRPVAPDAFAALLEKQASQDAS